VSDEATSLSLAKIRTDGGTQPRAALDAGLASDYAERIQAGDRFPAVVVFYDGSDYWLADGFHRVIAHTAAGRNRIAADVRQGTRRDAILHSVGVNAEHGRRRTNADKRRAVMVLLKDAEWSKWSDREIARRCRVSKSYASKLRPDPEPDGSLATVASERTYRTKHGTTATMKTDRINADREPKTPEPSDDDLVPFPTRTPAQEKESLARAGNLFRIIDALKALATHPESAAAWVEKCPKTSAYRVDEHLADAFEWISDLASEWGKRNG
jgi:hypothetical protein